MDCQIFMQLNGSEAGMGYERKIGIGSTSNPLTDIFTHSYHMSGWYCTDHNIV